jgi:hypothetical protein
MGETMNRSSKAALATALLWACCAAQAATALGTVTSGSYTADIVLDSSPTFVQDVTFTLNQPSVVTGTLDGVSLLTGASALRFTEMGSAPIDGTVSGNSFKLGLLPAPVGIGFDSGFYTLSLSGLAKAGVSSLKLTLNVTPAAVPELQSWALMALGLVGVAAVARRQRPAH